MTILDTNVLSELMKPDAAPSVSEWTERQPRLGLFTTAVTMAEVFCGLELLSAGRKRLDFAAATTVFFERVFKDRVLFFDADAAALYAQIAASRRKAGRPITPLDAQIAAIALSRGASLATRNTTDFEHTGLTLVDPWSS